MTPSVESARTSQFVQAQEEFHWQSLLFVAQHEHEGEVSPTLLLLSALVFHRNPSQFLCTSLTCTFIKKCFQCKNPELFGELEEIDTTPYNMDFAGAGHSDKSPKGSVGQHY